MKNTYQKIEKLFTKLSHLSHIERMMIWDEATMMPPGGGKSRGEALATLKSIQHNMLLDPKNIELVEEAKNQINLSEWEKSNINLIEKKLKAQACLPVKLVKELTTAAVESEQAWRQHRTENNWTGFLPYLEKTFSLVKESAQLRSETLELDCYDVLIDEYSPGLTQHFIDPIFNELKNILPPMIKKICDKQSNNAIIIPEGPFDITKQQQLGKELMKSIGFDFNRGRLDISHHPFCGGVPDDVRITTRYRNDEFISAMLGVCHETGHALYEQNLPEQWHHQPVGQALGMTVHESQSLIIEMQACRNREFIQFFSKKLETHFGNHKALQAENLYKLMTKVKPNLIRVDADEVTYPLHVILRYEIERDLLNNKISIQDLPEIWDSKMISYLGISTKDNYKDGVMQDVHWPAGTFGYFPAYTIGRLMAAQFYKSALKVYPEINNNLRSGNFSKLVNWLDVNIHKAASSNNFQSLLKNISGEHLNPKYFLDHVENKYG